MKLARLTRGERAAGWVEYHCPKHGGLVAGPSTLVVTCACGKRTVPQRNGRAIAKATLARLRRAAKGSA